MRPIHLVRLDKTRPAVVLTRESAARAMTSVTVVPITTTVRGLVTEVPVGPDNGLEQGGVISCDNVQTVSTTDLGRRVGVLLERQEGDLARALVSAFDLRVEDVV
ncbi:type II toxin-antitoxin system PemK/MazF family toxin [Aeromicrobium sp. Leaf350]|uniref:type II toxin-antitoxin system PemK/MazF family toxin n=1 Tax=Aeromicrobium sp. Leaf350 TaxID=2876565 RepID=UPI001E4908D6|nr:type II toxin-antitoxin system PemK/MazF family toxin [Aeromicrobium sp. Leaf350]